MVFVKFIDEEQLDSQKFLIEDNEVIGKPIAKKETNCVAKLVLDSLTDYPDTIAQIDAETGEQLTFGELKDCSIRCAVWLKKQGIGKNDVICTSTPNQINDCVPFLATFYVGAIFNPWFHDLTHDSARHFFEIIQPKVIFACNESIELLSQIAKELRIKCKFVVYTKHPGFVSLDDIMAEQNKEEINNFSYVEPEDPNNDIGVIFFSSGTTGTQKGTMLSYNSLVNHRMQQMMAGDGMVAFWYSTMSWITGANFITTCIRMRSTRIIHNNFDPEETAKVIEKYKVNWAFLTPSVLTQLYKAKVFDRYNFSSMEILATGGSKPSKAVLEYCRKALPEALVTNTFGMTELGGLAVFQKKNYKKIDSIGHIVCGVRMKVIDVVTGRKLGPNQQGELCFYLDTSMLGYIKNPTETKKMFDNEGYLRSGDLGYYDEDGEISITDRIKEVIITQNHHVSPSQIEGILLQNDEVKEVAVVPVPHQIDVERPMAFVVKANEAKITAEELMELPATYNEHFRLSGGVIFVDKLPYTTTGKKNLKELKDMAKAYAQ